MSIIKTVFDFDRELEYGPYAWPGGYPRYFITNDCAALSFYAAQQNADQIRDSIISNSNDGWKVVSVAINWEDKELFCDHTGERIPSAYGDD